MTMSPGPDGAAGGTIVNATEIDPISGMFCVLKANSETLGVPFTYAVDPAQKFVPPIAIGVRAGPDDGSRMKILGGPLKPVPVGAQSSCGGGCVGGWVGTGTAAT